MILAGLGELTLLHALTDVPVDECTLGVHQIELVVNAREHLGDGRRVGDHAHGTLHLGEIATRDDRGRLVVDAAFEAGRAPVDELDGALGLDRGDRGVGVLGDDVTAVHHAARHVLAVARVALGHHRGWLKHELVISATDSCSWYAFSAEMIGAYDESMKWMRGYGVRLVWNSVMSTFPC